MFYFYSFFCLLFFSSAISARTLFTTGYYTITRVDTHFPSGRPNSTNDVRFSFDVADTDPVTNTNTSCAAFWSVANGTYPLSWISCKDKRYGWYLSKYSTINNFTLELKHTFKDPSLGPPPYDVATTFGRKAFEPAIFSCSGAASGQYNCQLKDNTTVAVPIWGAIG